VFDWRDFLALAERLGDSPVGSTVSIIVDEAAQRSAVSRAYYAAFCHARVYAVQRLGFVPTNSPNDHGRLRAHYRARRMYLVASRLDRLRLQRNFCDYDDMVPLLPGIVPSALIDAAVVIRQL
jgi:hypothetical protein